MNKSGSALQIGKWMRRWMKVVKEEETKRTLVNATTWLSMSLSMIVKVALIIKIIITLMINSGRRMQRMKTSEENLSINLMDTPVAAMTNAGWS